MDFYDTLKKICIEHNTSVSRLEKDLGFSNGSLAKGVPRADRLRKIALYFDVPMEFFFEDADSAESYMKQARRDFKISLQKDIDELLEKPVFRASAGQGAFNDDFSDQTIRADNADSGYEFVEIVGDSMTPILQNGDIVKVELTTEVSPHDLAVVKIDGETSCVKYCEITDHGIWLKAENKAVYEDHFYSIQQVLTLPIVVIGRVVELRRKIK